MLWYNVWGIISHCRLAAGQNVTQFAGQAAS